MVCQALERPSPASCTSYIAEMKPTSTETAVGLYKAAAVDF